MTDVASLPPSGWNPLQSRASCASNRDNNKNSNMMKVIPMKMAHKDSLNKVKTSGKLWQRQAEDELNAKRQKFQDAERSEARDLMDIQFDKIDSGKFTLCHIELRTSDAEYFCSKLNLAFSLKEINFRNCNIDGNFLHTIKKKLQNGKVEHMNFSGNNQIDLPALANLMRRWGCKSLDLSHIEFDEKKMNDLQHITKLSQLETLILDYSSFSVTSNAPEHVAELLQSLKNFSFVSSNILTDQLRLIADNLSERINLQSLNLAHVQLEDGDLLAVCKIINKTNGMKKLSLSDSGLTAGKLEVFSDTVKQKIEELDLGLNSDIEPTKKNIEKIIEIVKGQHVRKLNLSGFTLNQQAMKQLTASDIPCGQITELNISENSGICISDVGEIAAKLKIENLDISECGLRVDDLKKLPIIIKNHKLRWIDVTESFRKLSEERRKEIKSILCTVAKEVRIEEARSLTH